MSPVFVTARLWQYPYFGNKYFCKLDWEESSRYHYTLVTNSFHFLLTLVVVCGLYAAIYHRLRSRYVLRLISQRRFFNHFR